MSLGHINSLVHELQVSLSKELNDNEKGQVARLMMSAIQYETKDLYNCKEDWKKRCLELEKYIESLNKR